MFNKKKGPLVILPDNNTMDPEKVGHSPLTLPPASTETHVFSALKNTSVISVGEIYDDGFQAILTKIFSSLG